ncbi:MAG: hypothetical protein V2A58_16990 [Planctomycetota bacterium]
MDYYAIRKEDFHKHSPYRFTVVKDAEALSRRCAQELAGILAANNASGRETVAILPVGPLDYGVCAEVLNAKRADCSRLVTLNMDEYLDEEGRLIGEEQPLSFRTFMKRTFAGKLSPERKFRLENLRFPDPSRAGETTVWIERIGGADIVFGGLGITGHFAFNDPPEPGEPAEVEAVANSVTRVVRIARESQAQMAMGGTGGNTEMLPREAITLGMKELRASRKVHLTFMRSWHAGVMRRALFGPIDARFPGSTLQGHRNLEVTVTELAAALPMANVAQAIGEK